MEEGSDNKEEQKIKVFCVDCREKDIPNLGWYWEGETHGYGPFDFICCSCGHVIYSPNVESQYEEKN